MKDKENNMNYLNFLKSKYILIQIFECVHESKYLNIIRFNKALQNKIDIDLNIFMKNYH